MSTVEITTTPAEVSSSTNQTIAQAFPSRLKKVNDTKKSSSKLFTTQFPLYKSQLESLNQEFEYLGEDGPLSTIITLAKTKSEKVNVLVRTKVFDHLGVSGKKGQTFEAFIYYKTVLGWTKTGESLGSAYISVGIDYQVPVTQRYDEDENPLAPEIGRKFEVHTIPWSVDTFEGDGRTRPLW